MGKNIYEVTHVVVTDSDGLVSHTLKGIKEITDIQEDEDENDNT